MSENKKAMNQEKKHRKDKEKYTKNIMNELKTMDRKKAENLICQIEDCLKI